MMAVQAAAADIHIRRAKPLDNRHVRYKTEATDG
jgi:hypothetical protein